MPTEHWDNLAQQERRVHDDLYLEQAKRAVEPLDWAYYYAFHRPAHVEGGLLYGLDVRLFLDSIDRELRRRDVNIRILDYACGIGELSVILARRGYRVCGFDLSETGVSTARSLARKYGVEGHAQFQAANAKQLPYADEQFDLVLGKAVLHHVIKYPGTAAELWRVLRPGGKVLFCEGSAGNPLVRLARRITLREEMGDVPLTPETVRAWAEAFSGVKSTGYFFLYMLRRLGYRYLRSGQTVPNKLGQTRAFRRLLWLGLLVDRLMVNRRWYSPRVAGRLLIELTK